MKIKRNISKPLYTQIEEIVLKTVIHSKTKEGEYFDSEWNLANKYNLNRLTVRQAISNLANKKILSRIPSKGIFINNIKLAKEELVNQQNRKKEENKTIGIIIYDQLDIYHPFLSRILQGINDIINQYNYDLVIYATKKGMSKNQSWKNLVFQEEITGILLITEDIDLQEATKFKNKIPLVIINNQIPGISSVCFDYKKGIYEAVKYLIKLGHKRIAFIGGYPKYRVTQEMLKGYKLALQEHNLKFDEFLAKFGSFQEQAGYQLTKELIESKTEFTAIQAGEDYIARGAIKVLQEKRFKVPEDVAVIGCNDVPIASSIKPELTTIKIPCQEIGMIGMDILLKKILKEKKYVKTVAINPKLIIRGTTNEKSN